MARRKLGRREFIAAAATTGVAIPLPLGAKSPSPRVPGPPGPAVQLALAGTRRELTIAEPVEIALVYSGPRESVTLEARHEDGSVVAIAIPVRSAEPASPRGRIVAIPPGLLKPGRYALRLADSDAAADPVEVGVHRDDHPSAYFVAAWKFSSRG